MNSHDVRNPFAPRRSSHRRPRPRAARLPAPEEVFVHWLLSVPAGDNLAAAARAQIALIDQRAPLHPDVACLRTLLDAVASDCSWRKPTLNL
jgi:hypothetical protein